MKAKLAEIVNDLYEGNIGVANSKYFSILDELFKNEFFLENAPKVLKLQENEDWVGLADIFAGIIKKYNKYL